MLDFWCSMSTVYVVGVRCSALAAALLESLTPFALLFFVLYGAVVLTICLMCMDGFLVLDNVLSGAVVLTSIQPVCIDGFLVIRYCTY